MPLDPQLATLSYSHANFGTKKSRVEFVNNGVYPQVQMFNEQGSAVGDASLQPQNNGSWVLRQHTHDAASALLVNSAGYEVTMGDGAPVVKLNGTQVYPS